MSSIESVEVIAGISPSGEAIVERVGVTPTQQGLQVTSSPLFAGLAKLDVITVDSKKKFSIVQHGGNLNIRVVSRSNANQLLEIVAKGVEELGGEISNQSERFFTITVHVGCEFRNIEKVLEHMMSQFPETSWAYTNVFDSETGEPLNWWGNILSEQ
ncbi:MAG: DUF4265 domain-containing protein [Gammaproteobacteria bacterium]|nr:DUF4265 domain-containing protein [Gammaproteobacteria bacterium]